jgi:hypothetical protein
MEDDTEQVDWTILIDTAKQLATLEITFRERKAATNDASK